MKFRKAVFPAAGLGTRFDGGNQAGFQMADRAFSIDRREMRCRSLPFIRDLTEAS